MSEILALAKATYNRGFELVVEGTDSDLLEGLELAAASLHLWRQVGTNQNVSIGLWLYARALGKAGSKQLALEASLESVRLAKIDGTDWLLASSLEGLARASQNSADFESNRSAAIAAIEAIADPEDRALIAGQFADLA